MYNAASGAAFWNDQGTLHVFVVRQPAINDYGDLTAGNAVVTATSCGAEAIARGR